MKRALSVVLLTLGAGVLLAGPASAQPVSGPASCQGYLASYANPNYAYIVHTQVLPKAADLGVTPGAVISSFAGQHGGSLWACIPD